MAKRYIINLFGESGAGKTSVLLRLKEFVMTRSRYVLEVAAGFTARDRRMMTWYSTGRKFSGAVCICTCGDTAEIINANIDFFNRHFNPPQTTPWKSWEPAYGCASGESTSQEATSPTTSEKGILVTASRKPLANYSNINTTTGFEVLDIPLRIDLWHDGTIGEKWCSSLFVPPEVLLFHINYILRNAAFKSVSNVNRHEVDFNKLKARISAD